MNEPSVCPALNRYHSFPKLVDNFSNELELRERFNSHRIRTMLDLGMCVPLSGFQLHLNHKLQSYEGYDAETPAVCLDWFKRDFAGETGKGVACYLAQYCGVEVDQADMFLGANSIAWGSKLESAKYEYLLERYDLVVMSNCLHYLKADHLRYVLRRVKAVCDAKTRIYMLVKENTEPMKQAGMTTDKLLEVCAAFAKELGLHEYPPVPVIGKDGMPTGDGPQHLWSNL
jgi:hypothetical protein